MKSKFKNGWHVLYVKHNHEKKVFKELNKIGLESFLPLVSKISYWSDRKKEILSPLFNSYVFVNVKSPMDFYKGLDVRGACYYLNFGNEIALVKEHEINAIKYFLNLGEVDIKEINVCKGQKIKIQKGPLTGFECEVFQNSKTSKVKVELGSLRQNITATVPIEYFKKEFSC